MEIASKESTSPPIQSLADELFADLAGQFPVCCASDEFHFFPQAAAGNPFRVGWDDFSSDAIQQCVTRLSEYRSRLDEMGSNADRRQDVIDISMLRRLVSTLMEQLTEVRFQETQPTFYLTIAAIGLAEALESGCKDGERRVCQLPEFLNQITQNLHRVPGLYRDLGCEMAIKLKSWLADVVSDNLGVAPVIEALDNLLLDLKRLPTVKRFELDVDLYARSAREHIGCQLDLTEIRQLLDAEIAETRQLLETEMTRFSSAHDWQAALQQIPVPDTPSGGAAQIYLAIIAELESHCRVQGMVSGDQVAACPVAVEPIPEYLAPIRSAAAYSMPPGHPPRGGIFYTMAAGSQEGVSQDYRLLTAHETYPGHHLLDTCRWRHPRPLRRHIEFPLFYEGWASFCEELLFDTGFFSGPTDRFLMAKRRFWRAVRGKIDLDIHTGSRNLEQAASFLTHAGLTKRRALSMVRRYALKPGYQLCYTIGRCSFRSLYDEFCMQGGRPNEFAVGVLNSGEVGFNHLKRLLIQP